VIKIKKLMIRDTSLLWNKSRKNAMKRRKKSKVEVLPHQEEVQVTAEINQNTNQENKKEDLDHLIAVKVIHQTSLTSQIALLLAL